MAEAAEVSTLLITEQLSRHEIDQQRRFLDAVLDSLHDGVTACDADGRIVFVNERMRRLLAENGPDEEGPGEHGPGANRPGAKGPGEHGLGDATWDDAAWLDRLTDADGNRIGRDQLGLFRALRGEHLRDEEMVLRGRGRRTRHYLVDAHPIAGPGGRTAGAVQAVQDVTRRRRVERFRMCELAVATALAEAPSIEAAGPRVLEAVVGTLGWAHAELWLVDDAAGVVRPVARWSAPGAAVDIDVPADLPYGQGLAGARLAGRQAAVDPRRRPAAEPDLPGDRREHPPARRAGHPGTGGIRDPRRTHRLRRRRGGPGGRAARPDGRDRRAHRAVPGAHPGRGPAAAAEPEQERVPGAGRARAAHAAHLDQRVHRTAARGRREDAGHRRARGCSR